LREVDKMTTEPRPLIDTKHLVKLDGSNYERWRLQISLVLKAAKLWQIASGETPRPATPDEAAK